jgi:predicted dehydrogenase/threonine dehydrogenase-like Zn-dependent dehydrogenase
MESTRREINDMLQVAQNYRSGELTVLKVPVPACLPGGVLVRTRYSLISAGTELMKVSEARMSLLGKARARPDQVRKVIDSAARQGPVAAYRKAIDQLDSYTPLGYSLCGEVIEVADGVRGFSVGDLVAAAGNEFALHAEVNWVPVNLCARVPSGTDPVHAAFATVGAIALQGVRQAEVQLGDTACVIGLGLVGQLVVRLLVAAGVRVLGVDTVAARCELAEQAGALACAGPDAAGVTLLEEALARATGGRGADRVFVAAGGDGAGPVELAARLARDRARIVDIGKTRLDLPWNAYYEKELELRFSRSYGPGRYDDRYEIDGIDYPVGYVPWTERRNLECFLDLVATKAVDVAPLVSGVHPVRDAPEVYRRLADGSAGGVGWLFEYPPAAPAATVTVLPVAPTRVRAPGRVGVGFIGAGRYACSMLLPHLAAADDVELRAVATTRSLSAVNAQRKFGFDRVSTDADSVLDDPAIDALFVVTRHHSHAALVCAALERGKAVFVEKPLALTDEQLEQIVETVRRTGNTRLMVGFNRRFAPLFGYLHDRRGGGATTMRYLVNAGRLEPGSWYLDEQLEGSRFVGEGGHFIDAMSAWCGAAPEQVFAQQTLDGLGLRADLRFEDGSLGVIDYVCTGSHRAPKESFDASCSGQNARLDNFTKATLWEQRRRSVKRSMLGPDKGQRRALRAFVESVARGTPMPIPLDSLVATTRATLAAAASARRGTAVRLGPALQSRPAVSAVTEAR